MIELSVKIRCIKTLKAICGIDLDRSMILGEDWLKKNRAQKNFNPNFLTIKEVLIPFGKSIRKESTVYSHWKMLNYPSRRAFPVLLD